MSNQDDYQYIRMHGHQMGSNESYIDWQVEQACKENAPQNAVYRDHKGVWHTTDDYLRDEVRSRYGLEPLPNSALPATYEIEIELDWTEPSGAILTVTRAGFRHIYRDRFGTVQEASDRAVLEIKADQAQKSEG